MSAPEKIGTLSGCVFGAFVLSDFFGGRGSLTGQKPGREPLWSVSQEPREIFIPLRVRLQIVLNRRLPRTTQSVAGLSAMRDSMIFTHGGGGEKTLHWVIPRSRLFKISFGGNRAVKKVARSLCYAPKRLPSRVYRH
jgi:hypothetical protein